MNELVPTPPDAGRNEMSVEIALIADAMQRASAGDDTVRIASSICCRELVGVAAIFDAMTEKLEKSELRFRSFVENINDVLFALTPAGDFSYVSPQWKTAFGYELSDTIGHSFVPFVHPEDVQRCFEFLQLVMVTGEKQSGVEYRVLCKDGNYLWYKANASLVVDPDGGVPTLVAIGRDISERKKNEEALRRSEEKFSAVFRASPDAVTLTRVSDGTHQDVNEGFTALTGYLPEEALGKMSCELNLWVDPELRLEFMKKIRINRIIKDMEVNIRHKDGTILICILSARIIEIKGEEYILGVTRDISTRDRIQKELVKAQKLESISILAGGIAHNFNNVLTGVIGYISFAKKHLRDSDKIESILDSAEKASYRAAGLARQLLTFSQSNTKVRKPVVVDKLIEDSVALFQAGSNVTVDINCRANRNILADKEHVTLAFNNIILNALHAMPKDGKLTILSDVVTLTYGNVFALPPADYVRVVIEDNGLGIETDVMDKIFDPYFTTKKQGTGLGLSTAHAIIAKHGGCINISSESGKGTTVTILIPILVESQERA